MPRVPWRDGYGRATRVPGRGNQTMVAARIAGSLFASLLAWTVAGTAPIAAQTQATASVRLVHVASGIAAVDLLIDGQPLVTSLAYRGASEYAPLPLGRHAIRLTAAGQPGQVLADGVVDLQAGQHVTIAATGDAPTIATIAIIDDTSPPPAGQAKIRFVHGAPDIPAVDVATRGGAIIFGNVTFREVENYVGVPAGTYTLEMRPTGQSAVALLVPNVTLSPGQVVTIFAAGKAADNTLAAILVVYQSTTPAAGTTTQAVPVSVPRTGTGLVADSVTANWAIAGLLLFVVLVGGVATSARIACRRSQ